MKTLKIATMLLALTLVTMPTINFGIVVSADAKENCTKGYKWNKKTKKCEEDPGSY